MQPTFPCGAIGRGVLAAPLPYDNLLQPKARQGAWGRNKPRLAVCGALP